MGKDDNEKRAATDKGAQNGIKERLFEVVSQKTGFPKEMLDLNLDLEADFGIDATKHDEILGTLCEIYNIPLREKPVPRSVPTLAHMIDFFSRERPNFGGSGPNRAIQTEEGPDVSQGVSVLDQPALDDISDVVAAAKEVFGADDGLRWLGTPVPALKYATPISLVDTAAGRQEIRDALVNLAHGNW